MEAIAAFLSSKYYFSSKTTEVRYYAIRAFVKNKLDFLIATARKCNIKHAYPAKPAICTCRHFFCYLRFYTYVPFRNTCTKIVYSLVNIICTRLP